MLMTENPKKKLRITKTLLMPFNFRLKSVVKRSPEKLRELLLVLPRELSSNSMIK